MHIVHVAAELAPIAKVGGLADVTLGLCRELSWKGHDIDLVLPKYDCMDSDQIRDMSIVYQDLLSFYQGEWHHNTVWVGWVENLKVYFIEPRHPRQFFNRACFYGCEDDVERFLYFSRAALEFLYKKGIQPDVLHLHDWQTAAIAPLYHDMYKPLGMKATRIIFTSHNFDYQGQCAPHDLDSVGLKGISYLTEDNMQDDRNPTLINLTKGAFKYADFITTVSPNYAREVKTAEGGKGLETTVLKYQTKFKGILNGLDYSYWNPESDRFLPAHFSSRETPLNKEDRHTLDRKAFLKRILRETLDLEERYSPIVACIARLVPQKGLELIKRALVRTIEKGGQFVLLGSSPIPSIATDFHALKVRYADNPNVHLVLHPQESLAHLIFAGADMILVPSLFEPCGLTQLIALRYGAIPVVRRTGGLADTIFDVDTSTRRHEETNGYTFDSPTAEGLDSALDRALASFAAQPDKWRKLIIRGMNLNYSWSNPAEQYLEIYKAPPERLL